MRVPFKYGDILLLELDRQASILGSPIEYLVVNFAIPPAGVTQNPKLFERYNAQLPPISMTSNTITLAHNKAVQHVQTIAWTYRGPYSYVVAKNLLEHGVEQDTLVEMVEAPLTEAMNLFVGILSAERGA